jgi:hypothetical protein
MRRHAQGLEIAYDVNGRWFVLRHRPYPPTKFLKRGSVNASPRSIFRHFREMPTFMTTSSHMGIPLLDIDRTGSYLRMSRSQMMMVAKLPWKYPLSARNRVACDLASMNQSIEYLHYF